MKSQGNARNSRFENNEVAITIADIVPRIVHLALWTHGGQLGSSSGGHVATRRRAIVGGVDGRGTKLIVDITREVPIQFVLLSANRGGIRLGDEVEAVLVGDLEKERNIAACSTPATFKQRIGMSIKSVSGRRVVEFREVIIFTMNDYR